MRAVVSASGSGMTCTLGYRFVSGITLGGAGGDGSIIEVLMGAALLECNGAAPIGGLLTVGREVVMAISRLRPLRRKDGGGCGAGVDAGGWVETLGFERGVAPPGVRDIGDDGNFRVVVWAANILASWRNASSCGSETGANGDAGYG